MSSRTITTKEMIRFERESERSYGLPPLLLMENAGRSVAEHILKLESLQKLKVLVLCGPGNNGGDAAVAARHLHLAGRRVEVALFTSNKKRAIATNALQNLMILKKMGLYSRSNIAIQTLHTKCKEKIFVLDGLFGTGLNRKILPPFSDVIDTVNQSHKMVYSIDIPSGIHSDDGVSLGCSVNAIYTGALGFIKKGLRLGAGRKAAGAIQILPIGLPMQRIKYEY